MATETWAAALWAVAMNRAATIVIQANCASFLIFFP